METASSKVRVAPGSLALVQEFINTNDDEEGRDELLTPAALGTWLLSRGLISNPHEVTSADLRTALAVREALRELAHANSGPAPGSQAAEVLNSISAELPLTIRFHEDGTSHLEPAQGSVEGAMASLLSIVHAATIEGTWRRFKICRNDVCRWAFYDYSKNRSAVWCTMTECGAKMKARAYRARRKDGAHMGGKMP
jgi:predicted RNA-binding Zn ribbon-like protein